MANKNINPPWNISPDENNGVTLVCSQESGDIVYRIDSFDIGNKRTRTRLARLASAAPMFYEAAEKIIEQHNKNAEPYGPCLCDECCMLMRALEKANGMTFQSLKGRK